MLIVDERVHSGAGSLIRGGVMSNRCACIKADEQAAHARILLFQRLVLFRELLVGFADVVGAAAACIPTLVYAVSQRLEVMLYLIYYLLCLMA